jgi:hypothetical protein
VQTTNQIKAEVFLKFAVITLAVAIAVARPFLPPHPVSIQGSYEALAHLVVGGIFGAWLANRKSWLLFTGIGITAVEVICAAASFFM